MSLLYHTLGNNSRRKPCMDSASTLSRGAHFKSDADSKKEKQHPNRSARHPGIRCTRRYPHSAPAVQARRSTSGVCELDSASPAARGAQFKSDDDSKKRKTALQQECCFSWRRHPDLNWGMKLLQSFALPLGHGAV